MDGKLIVRLSDGETWDLTGNCAILAVPDDWDGEPITATPEEPSYPVIPIHLVLNRIQAIVKDQPKIELYALAGVVCEEFHCWDRNDGTNGGGPYNILPDWILHLASSVLRDPTL